MFHDLKNTFGERTGHIGGSNLRNLIVGTSKLMNYLGHWIELGMASLVGWHFQITKIFISSFKIRVEIQRL